MTTIPRMKQTTDYELRVLTRICDLISTLGLDARKRVIGYVIQRSDTLPVLAADEEPEQPAAAGVVPLFDAAGA